VSSPAAARVRIIAISGTIPDPPATSISLLRPKYRTRDSQAL
jgi:hypothetical protein